MAFLPTPILASPTLASAERPYVVAPSDLVFLFNECARCFHAKIALGTRRPSSPMPKIFRVLDGLQRKYFDGQRAELVSPSLPPGRLSCADVRLLSRPIEIGDGCARIRFRGATDALIHFDDDTYGIVDFKTVNPAEGHVGDYWRQLHAYAWMLEQPDFTSPLLSPVTTLGLLCIEPTSMAPERDGSYAYGAKPTWIPVERDDGRFEDFLAGVADVLTSKAPPEPGPRCSWCKYS